MFGLDVSDFTFATEAILSLQKRFTTLVTVLRFRYGQNVCVAREPSGAFKGKLKKRGRREDFGHWRSCWFFMFGSWVLDRTPSRNLLNFGVCHIWELGQGSNSFTSVSFHGSLRSLLDFFLSV